MKYWNTHLYKLHCRNPEQSKRASFEEVSETLMMEDEKLLSWSEVVPEATPGAKQIGAPLENGHNLYIDLQNTYNPGSSEMNM